MDTIDACRRSRNMSLIRSKNTAPELNVRKLLCELGYKHYRLHRKDLPGRPDIVFPGRRLAIHVHGCFWHGHTCSEGIRKPKSRLDYWIPKLTRNRERDLQNDRKLRRMGWRTITIWDCELKSEKNVISKLSRFLK